MVLTSLFCTLLSFILTFISCYLFIQRHPYLLSSSARQLVSSFVLSLVSHSSLYISFLPTVFLVFLCISLTLSFTRTFHFFPYSLFFISVLNRIFKRPDVSLSISIYLLTISIFTIIQILPLRSSLTLFVSFTLSLSSLYSLFRQILTLITE